MSLYICNKFSLNLVGGGACTEGPMRLELDIDDGPGSGFSSDKATLLKMASYETFLCHQCCLIDTIMPSVIFPFVFTMYPSLQS